METKPILHYPGELAYLDSFVGLIPCKVLGIQDDTYMTILITANRKGYSKGEVKANCYQRSVVPRANIFRRNHCFYIRGGYMWAQTQP